MFKNTLRLLAVVSLFASMSLSAAEVVGKGVVTWVVDGDTYWIKPYSSADFRGITKDARSSNMRVTEGTFKTRLLNVDTEESVHRDKSRNTPFGKETSNVMKSRLYQQEVTFYCDGVGNYGRPLCRVETVQGDVGLFLIANGYSKYVTYFGRSKALDSEYVHAEMSARRSKLGIWR